MRKKITFKPLIAILIAILFLSVALTVLISGYGEIEKKDLELEFIEVKVGDEVKVGNEVKIINEDPYLVFVSHEEKAYFKMYITSYEYNNLELKKGDKITFSVMVASPLNKAKYITKWQGERNKLTEFDYLKGENE